MVAQGSNGEYLSLFMYTTEQVLQPEKVALFTNIIFITYPAQNWLIYQLIKPILSTYEWIYI